ncbi:MAG TPA: septum formation protein Maf [Rhodospirillaceae bacterium]|nr:septum formation protein Maf [Rhodospirillaceae bacterium]
MNPDGLVRPVVLASASAVRTKILTAAGVPHETVPADLNESEVRERLLIEATPHLQIAEILAELKAQTIAAARPDAIVLGADQVLSCAGELFQKPDGLVGMRDHLRRLGGRSHTLHAAVCAVVDREVVWHHCESAKMHMRVLSDDFIDGYIKLAGLAACRSVGAYEIEGAGVQLFSRIDGDFFTILGLPMLPVLDFLRREGVVMT